MRRLVCSVFAVAYVVTFNGCEGHSADTLPPHYQHKMHHGHTEDSNHPPVTHEGETKDPNRKHEEAAIPANPEAKPGGNPVKKH
jgi:hypothetical protein